MAQAFSIVHRQSMPLLEGNWFKNRARTSSIDHCVSKLSPRMLLIPVNATGGLSEIRLELILLRTFQISTSAPEALWRLCVVYFLLQVPMVDRSSTITAIHCENLPEYAHHILHIPMAGLPSLSQFAPDLQGPLPSSTALKGSDGPEHHPLHHAYII